MLSSTTTAIPFLLLLFFESKCQFINPAEPSGGRVPPPTEEPVPDFSQNPVWPIGSVQPVEWSESIGTYNLRLYQRFVTAAFPDINGYIHSYIGNGVGHQTFNWTVYLGPGYVSNIGFGNGGSEVFYFQIESVQANAEELQSRFINITGPKSDYPPLPSITTTMPAPAPSTSTGSSPTSSGTDRPLTAPSNTLKQSTKIGVGVGLGMGVPVLLVLGALLSKNILRRGRTRRYQRNTQRYEDLLFALQNESIPKYPDDGRQRQEMPVGPHAGELPGGGYRRELGGNRHISTHVELPDEQRVAEMPNTSSLASASVAGRSELPANPRTSGVGAEHLHPETSARTVSRRNSY